MTQAYRFPSVWPGAIDYTASGEALPEPSGPPIAVSTMRYADGQEGSGPTTAEILTSVLIQRMQKKGLAARPLPAQEPVDAERADCTVEKLAYTINPKYPRTVVYEAELACALTAPNASLPRWEQRLAQRYEKITVLNTMTKLPVQYEQTLYAECIVPLWDAMAVSLKTYLDYEPVPPAASAPETPAGRRTYSK